MGNVFMDKTQYLTYIDTPVSTIEPIDYAITSGIDTVRYELNELQKRINYEGWRIDELQANLRSVMDEISEKPKQKWLWEIFEPNDIEIDFSYNL